MRINDDDDDDDDLQGAWVKKTKLLILREYVNKTKKIAGT